MTETKISSSAPAKPRRWLRGLAWVVGILAVLVVALYFVATSSAFFKGFILPRASAALNAKLSVSDASLSPFSQIILHNLKVETTGAEPLVVAPEVRLRYSLFDILGGNIHVDEITLSSPTVVLEQNPDGTSNLDPILKAQNAKPEAAKPTQKAQPAKSTKPMQVFLGKLALTDATLKREALYASGKPSVAEISHLNVTLTNVKNGQSGNLVISADLSMDHNPPAPQPAGLLQAKLNGSYNFALSPDLKLSSLKGNLHLDITRAEGALAQVSSLSADLDCETTANEIKQLSLHFQKGAVSLGQLRLAGPFDMAKTEGKLLLTVSSIDKQLLNLAAAASGLDFGPTTIGSTNQIELANAGATITLGGQFNVNSFQVTRAGQTSPALDLKANYRLSIDNSQKTLALQEFALTGTQKGSQLVHGELASPMRVAWGNAANGVGDSTLTLALTGLDLASWNALLGGGVSSGIVNAQAKLVSQQAGKQLSFELGSQLENFSVGSGSNQLSQVKIDLALTGKATDLKQFNLSSYKLQVGQQGRPPITLSGSATYDLTAGTAQLTAALASVNQDALRPLVQPMLADKTLVSAAVQANASVNYNPSGASQIKAGLQLTNLVLNDLKGQPTSSPLAVDLQVDTSLDKQMTELRQVQIALTPTSRATNKLQISGRIDSQTNGVQGSLKIAADALDLTSYYAAFTGGQKAAAKPSANPSAQPAQPQTKIPQPAAAAEKEPDAIRLPLHNFTVDASIGHIYLDEMDITNLTATLKMDAGHIVLNPCQFAVNGAPVSALLDVDLGVPGFKYDVSFNAQAVPLAPLVNSFQPERKGQLGGSFTATAKIDGAGTTGPSLQKNLTGQFSLSSTNLNLSVANVKNPILKTVVNVVSIIPELLRNPTGALGSLLGTPSSSGGLATDLSRSPIDAIIAQGSIGSGKLNLQKTMVRSSVFEADAPGTITLAAVLTNSPIQIPVHLSLSRSVAQSLNLAGNAPTNAAYAQLPDFFTLTGTIGNPDKRIDKVALVSMTAQGITGAVPGLNQTAGDVVQGVRALLGPSTNSTAANTNNPGAQSPINNLLNGLLGPKKK